MRPKITSRWEHPFVKEYECQNCEGVFQINISKDPDKATFPLSVSGGAKSGGRASIEW